MPNCFRVGLYGSRFILETRYGGGGKLLGDCLEEFSAHHVGLEFPSYSRSNPAAEGLDILKLL